MSEKEECSQNTDKIIWKEPHSDHWGSFDDYIFVTETGGIGVNVAGMVYVKPLKEWHSLESSLSQSQAEVKELTKVIEDRGHAFQDAVQKAMKDRDFWKAQAELST